MTNQTGYIVYATDSVGTSGKAKYSRETDSERVL